MRTPARTLSGMFFFTVLALALGCGTGAKPTTPPTTPTPVATSSASGPQVFTQHCAKCHATEPGKRGKGPSLAGIGSKPEKPLDWIIAHIKSPATHKPTSTMTAFEGTLSETEIKTVAEYLTTLK